MTICRVGKGALATCPPSLWRWARFYLRSLSYRRTWSLCPPYESVHASAFSRRDFARAIINSSPRPQTRGRRECRVRAAPAVSCAKNVHYGAREHTGQRKHSDIPCAMALRLISRSPRWSGLVVTVIPEKLASQELDASIAAPGPHDFAVRLRSVVCACAPETKASIASPTQRIVTIAKRPSCGPGWARL